MFVCFSLSLACALLEMCLCSQFSLICLLFHFLVYFVLFVFRPKESTKKNRDATSDVVSRDYTINLHKRIHGV